MLSRNNDAEQEPIEQGKILENMLKTWKIANRKLWLEELEMSSWADLVKDKI